MNFDNLGGLPPPNASNTASEKESRGNIMKWAKACGCEVEVRQIFNRYDGLMKLAQTNAERLQISHEGIKALDAFIVGRNNLIIMGSKYDQPEETN